MACVWIYGFWLNSEIVIVVHSYSVWGLGLHLKPGSANCGHGDPVGQHTYRDVSRYSGREETGGERLDKEESDCSSSNPQTHWACDVFLPVGCSQFIPLKYEQLASPSRSFHDVLRLQERRRDGYFNSSLLRLKSLTHPTSMPEPPMFLMGARKNTLTCLTQNLH